jgi:CDP-glucose 4,6-dehydratase
MKHNDTWLNRNVFVTGCSGFLGGWLCKTLIERGANVTGLVRDHVPAAHLMLSETIDRMNVVWGEIENYFLLERILNEYEIDTVFHLAAQTIVTIANRNPMSTFDTNIRGTYCLLEACRRSTGVGRIVVASSDKAYGEHRELPYAEDTPLVGAHPYDVSKSCADLIALAFHKTYGLPVCVTRCGNFYGGGDLNFNRIVPGTIRDVLQNRQPVIRSDGAMIRDYFYILDGVGAYLLLAEKMEEIGCFGEAFNFSNELQVTVKQITELILRLMQREDIGYRVLNETKNEIPHQYLAADKARTRLGWRPKFGLEQGLMATIDWYRRYFDDQGRVDRSAQTNPGRARQDHENAARR